MSIQTMTGWSTNTNLLKEKFADQEWDSQSWLMTEWDQVLEKCLRHLRYKYVAIQIHCNTNTNTLQYKYVRNSDMSQVAAVAD